jgi:hypothetical protein
MRVRFSVYLRLPQVLPLALVGLISYSVAAAGQSTAPPSLAELARQEAERRKTTKDAPKVITAKDLPESARKPVPAPATTPTTHEGGVSGAPSHVAGDPKPAPPASVASGGQADEESWRSRITQAREGLRRNETFLQALQNRANALYNDFRNGAGDFTQQAQVNAERQQTAKEIERVSADVESSKKQVADIEEEARKAGVPPGWLR